MGIGGPALGLLSIAYENECFDPKKRVCELGNQELNQYHAHFSIDFPFASRPANWPSHRVIDASERKQFEKMKASDLYKKIGFTQYTSIDINGLDGAEVFDFNNLISESYEFEEQFDLVTNFGTTEHISNQAMAFRNIHNLCARDGIMMGMVPFQGAAQHGLFNYQPSFFEELARANDYELLGLYFTIAHYQLYTAFPYPLDEEIMRELYANLDFHCGPYGFEQEIGYILRKTHDKEFQAPYQTTQVMNNQIGLELGALTAGEKLAYSNRYISLDEFMLQWRYGKKAVFQRMWINFKSASLKEKCAMLLRKIFNPAQSLRLFR